MIYLCRRCHCRVVCQTVPGSTFYGILLSLLCWLLLVGSAGSVVLAAKEDMVSDRVEWWCCCLFPVSDLNWPDSCSLSLNSSFTVSMIESMNKTIFCHYANDFLISLSNQSLYLFLFIDSISNPLGYSGGNDTGVLILIGLVLSNDVTLRAYF